MNSIMSSICERRNQKYPSLQIFLLLLLAPPPEIASKQFTPHILLILPYLLLPDIYLEVFLSVSGLVSLTVSSQILLFLKLQLKCQFPETFLDP